MSNLPSFLPAKNPHQAVLTNGDPYPLTPVEITTLLRDINALHFRPQIIVAPSTFHVKDGSTLASDIVSAWKLGPHSLLVVYAPADKNVWVQCGAFNSSAGVDSQFFKHDFLQRMSGSSQDGNLASALTASLKDVDQIIVRSQAFAAAQVNRQTSEVQPRHFNHAAHHTSHGGAATLMQILPAVLLALVVLNFIGRSLGKAAPRRRFDDPQDQPADLSDDVDRILKVIHHSDGASSGALKPRNTQVPMAEFKKRADSPVKVSARGAGALRVSAFGAGSGRREDQNSDFANTSQQNDHSSELSTAIDSLAANVQRDHKEKIASSAYSPSTIPDESRPAVVQDGKFIDSYVATFSRNSATQDETVAPVALSTPSTPSTPSISSTPSTPSISGIPGTPSIPSTPSTPSSSFDLSAFSLQAASAPFADVLSSMGSNLGDMKTSSGGSLPLGSLASFDTNRDTSAVQANCPKCSEPKSKDFSFCLKCGLNF
jgi:hypothetical protein